jgi:hypothetical protein
MTLKTTIFTALFALVAASFGSSVSARGNAGVQRARFARVRVAPRRNYKVRRLRDAGKRQLGIGSLKVVGKRSLKPTKRLTVEQARQQIKLFGGTLKSANYKNGRLHSLTFTAKSTTVLGRLGSIVARVNKPKAKAQNATAKAKTSKTGRISSTNTNAEHHARSLQPGYRDSNVSTRSAYLRNNGGHNSRWGHGRYRVR